tara:strand:- start:1509 stop:2174 length:666 start_codon:yes stop_codon:yes gene_type:complete
MIINKKLVETLQDQINKNELRFYWYITIVYHNKMELDDVRSDNKRFRYVIRKFFRSNIRMWFFNEIHHESVKLKGGYHKHIWMESIPEDCWKTRSNQMDKILMELDPSIMFGINFGDLPTVSQQTDLLDKVIRSFNKSIPNGKDAVKIKLISEDLGGVKGLCVYNTKDNWRHGERIEEVIDWENSDCLDIEPLAKLKNVRQNSIIDFTRHKNLFAGIDRSL